MLAGLGAQAQVLVTNSYLNLGKLSAELLTQVCAQLGNHDQNVRPLAARAARHLLCVPAATVRSIISRLQQANWIPRQLTRETHAKDGSEDDESNSAHKSRRDASAITRVLIREALFCISRGESTDFFLQNLARLRLYSVDVGDKYASRQYLQLVEMACGRLLQLQDAQQLHELLPGLNVQAPISICYDGVSIGESLFSRSESFEIVFIFSASVTTGQMQAFFIGCPSEGLDKTGEGQAQCVAKALEQHPWNLGQRNIRSRLLSMVCGDGAIVRGGPDARHSSTGSANILSQRFYQGQQELAQWELFHRSEAAFRHAVAGSEPAAELFSVARGMQFGHGVGRVLLRSVAEFSDSSARAAADTGGTRQGESLVRIASNMVRNFKLYGLGIHAKILRKREGHGATSQSKLAVLGRRFLSMDFVTFLCCFQDHLHHCSQSVEGFRVGLQ